MGDRATGRTGDRTTARLGASRSDRKGPKRGSGRFGSLSVTLLAAVLLLAPGALTAQLHGQHWDVTPETARPTVGDTITLAFRVRLDERDLLYDTVPKPALTPPDWIRIFSVEKLQRQPDRIFTGHARIAFYRPGRQTVPLFELPFMRSVKGLTRGTLTSDSASVEVVPVLTAGASATLRDIKEPVHPQGTLTRALLLGLAAVAAGWLAWRARRRAAVQPTVVEAELVPEPPPDPYELALARLNGIERERWPLRDVARHYAEVTGALRDYLEAYAIPARERTTSELRWVLPDNALAGERESGFEAVFETADLVKFARWRPSTEEVNAFTAAARDLLETWRTVEWHEAAAVEGPS
jgi:hypothetical protein